MEKKEFFGLLKLALLFLLVLSLSYATRDQITNKISLDIETYAVPQSPTKATLNVSVKVENDTIINTFNDEGKIIFTKIIPKISYVKNANINVYYIDNGVKKVFPNCNSITTNKYDAANHIYYGECNITNPNPDKSKCYVLFLESDLGSLGKLERYSNICFEDNMKDIIYTSTLISSAVKQVFNLNNYNVSNALCLPAFLILFLSLSVFYYRTGALGVMLLDIISPKVPKGKKFKYSIKFASQTSQEKEAIKRNLEHLIKNAKGLLKDKKFLEFLEANGINLSNLKKQLKSGGLDEKVEAAKRIALLRALFDNNKASKKDNNDSFKRVITGLKNGANLDTIVSDAEKLLNDNLSSFSLYKNLNGNIELYKAYDAMYKHKYGPLLNKLGVNKLDKLTEKAEKALNKAGLKILTPLAKQTLRGIKEWFAYRVIIFGILGTPIYANIKNLTKASIDLTKNGKKGVLGFIGSLGEKFKKWVEKQSMQYGNNPEINKEGGVGYIKQNENTKRVLAISVIKALLKSYAHKHNKSFEDFIKGFSLPKLISEDGLKSIDIKAFKDNLKFLNNLYEEEREVFEDLNSWINETDLLNADAIGELAEKVGAYIDNGYLEAEDSYVESLQSALNEMKQGFNEVDKIKDMVDKNNALSNLLVNIENKYRINKESEDALPFLFKMSQEELSSSPYLEELPFVNEIYNFIKLDYKPDDKESINPVAGAYAKYAVEMANKLGPILTKTAHEELYKDVSKGLGINKEFLSSYRKLFVEAAKELLDINKVKESSIYKLFDQAGYEEDDIIPFFFNRKALSEQLKLVEKQLNKEIKEKKWGEDKQEEIKNLLEDAQKILNGRTNIEEWAPNQGAIDKLFTYAGYSKGKRLAIFSNINEKGEFLGSEESRYKVIEDEINDFKNNPQKRQRLIDHFKNLIEERYRRENRAINDEEIEIEAKERANKLIKSAENELGIYKSSNLSDFRLGGIFNTEKMAEFFKDEKIGAYLFGESLATVKKRSAFSTGSLFNVMSDIAILPYSKKLEKERGVKWKKFYSSAGKWNVFLTKHTRRAAAKPIIISVLSSARSPEVEAAGYSTENMNLGAIPGLIFNAYYGTVEQRGVVDVGKFVQKEKAKPESEEELKRGEFKINLSLHDLSSLYKSNFLLPYLKFVSEDSVSNRFYIERSGILVSTKEYYIDKLKALKRRNPNIKELRGMSDEDIEHLNSKEIEKLIFKYTPFFDYHDLYSKKYVFFDDGNGYVMAMRKDGAHLDDELSNVLANILDINRIFSLIPEELKVPIYLAKEKEVKQFVLDLIEGKNRTEINKIFKKFNFSDEEINTLLKQFNENINNKALQILETKTNEDIASLMPDELKPYSRLFREKDGAKQLLIEIFKNGIDKEASLIKAYIPKQQKLLNIEELLNKFRINAIKHNLNEEDIASLMPGDLGDALSDYIIRKFISDMLKGNKEQLYKEIFGDFILGDTEIKALITQFKQNINNKALQILETKTNKDIASLMPRKLKNFVSLFDSSDPSYILKQVLKKDPSIIIRGINKNIETLITQFKQNINNKALQILETKTNEDIASLMPDELKPYSRLFREKDGAKQILIEIFKNGIDKEASLIKAYIPKQQKLLNIEELLNKFRINAIKHNLNEEDIASLMPDELTSFKPFIKAKPKKILFEAFNLEVGHESSPLFNKLSNNLDNLNTLLSNFRINAVKKFLNENEIKQAIPKKLEFLQDLNKEQLMKLLVAMLEEREDEAVKKIKDMREAPNKELLDNFRVSLLEYLHMTPHSVVLSAKAHPLNFEMSIIMNGGVRNIAEIESGPLDLLELFLASSDRKVTKDRMFFVFKPTKDKKFFVFDNKRREKLRDIGNWGEALFVKEDRKKLEKFFESAQNGAIHFLNFVSDEGFNIRKDHIKDLDNLRILLKAYNNLLNKHMSGLIEAIDKLDKEKETNKLLGKINSEVNKLRELGIRLDNSFEQSLSDQDFNKLFGLLERIDNITQKFNEQIVLTIKSLDGIISSIDTKLKDKTLNERQRDQLITFRNNLSNSRDILNSLDLIEPSDLSGLLTQLRETYEKASVAVGKERDAYLKAVSALLHFSLIKALDNMLWLEQLNPKVSYERERLDVSLKNIKKKAHDLMSLINADNLNKDINNLESTLIEAKEINRSMRTFFVKDFNIFYDNISKFINESPLLTSIFNINNEERIENLAKKALNGRLLSSKVNHAFIYNSFINEVLNELQREKKVSLINELKNDPNKEINFLVDEIAIEAFGGGKSLLTKEERALLSSFGSLPRTYENLTRLKSLLIKLTKNGFEDYAIHFAIAYEKNTGDGSLLYALSKYTNKVIIGPTRYIKEKLEIETRKETRTAFKKLLGLHVGKFAILYRNALALYSQNLNYLMKSYINDMYAAPFLMAFNKEVHASFLKPPLFARHWHSMLEYVSLLNRWKKMGYALTKEEEESLEYFNSYIQVLAWGMTRSAGRVYAVFDPGDRESRMAVSLHGRSPHYTPTWLSGMYNWYKYYLTSHLGFGGRLRFLNYISVYPWISLNLLSAQMANAIARPFASIFTNITQLMTYNPPSDATLLKDEQIIIQQLLKVNPTLSEEEAKNLAKMFSTIYYQKSFDNPRKTAIMMPKLPVLSRYRTLFGRKTDQINISEKDVVRIHPNIKGAIAAAAAMPFDLAFNPLVSIPTGLIGLGMIASKMISPLGFFGLYGSGGLLIGLVSLGSAAVRTGFGFAHSVVSHRAYSAIERPSLLFESYLHPFKGQGLGEAIAKLNGYRPKWSVTPWYNPMIAGYHDIPGYMWLEYPSGLIGLEPHVLRTSAFAHRFGPYGNERHDYIDELDYYSSYERYEYSLVSRYRAINKKLLGFSPKYNFSWSLLSLAFALPFSEYIVENITPWFYKKYFRASQIMKEARMNKRFGTSRLGKLGLVYALAPFGDTVGKLTLIAASAGFSTAALGPSIAAGLLLSYKLAEDVTTGSWRRCPVCGRPKPPGPCPYCGFNPSSKRF